MNAGLVVVDKPAGMTSHDVVGCCRRIFGTRRVGHAGTLDPMATGVLVIGIERATKILGLVAATSKSYAATVRLGQSTSTEDAEGELLQQVSAQNVTAIQNTSTDPRRTWIIMMLAVSVSILSRPEQPVQACPF